MRTNTKPSTSLLGVKYGKFPALRTVIHHQRLARLLIHHLGSIGRVILPIAKPLFESRRAHLHPLAVGQFGFVVSLSLLIGFLTALFLRRFFKL